MAVFEQLSTTLETVVLGDIQGANSSANPVSYWLYLYSAKLFSQLRCAVRRNCCLDYVHGQHLFWVNKALQYIYVAAEFQGGGRGEWWGYKVQNCDPRNQSSHPESRLWLGLGNKHTLVIFGQNLWLSRTKSWRKSVISCVYRHWFSRSGVVNLNKIN